MKGFLLLAALSVAVLSGGYVMATVPGTPIHEDGLVEHGGGCRKDSPPGLCCHKNHKTGEVHCH